MALKSYLHCEKKYGTKLYIFFFPYDSHKNDYIFYSFAIFYVTAYKYKFLH